MHSFGFGFVLSLTLLSLGARPHVAPIARTLQAPLTAAPWSFPGGPPVPDGPYLPAPGYQSPAVFGGGAAYTTLSPVMVGGQIVFLMHGEYRQPDLSP